MQKYYKISLIAFVVSLFLFLVYFAAAIYIHDPLQIWHKAFFRNQTYSNSMRESARAFIRDYEFDSVIMGNSHTENTSAKDAEKLLGGKFFNLSISGSTLNEKAIVLKYLLKNKNIKKIIFAVDSNYVILNKENPQYPIRKYEYLYNDNHFDDYKYYLNDRYFLCSIRFDKSSACVGSSLNLDKPYAWGDSITFNRRFGGFNKWLAVAKTDKAIQAYFEIISNKIPLELNNEIVTQSYINSMKKYFDDNLLSIIEENPNIEFILIIPPVSEIELGRRLREKTKTAKKYNYMLKYLTSKAEKLHNIKIFAFDDSKELSKIENFKDGTHFKPDINYYILEAIAKDKHRITSKNVTKYLDAVHKKSIEIDYEYYYNTIKNF